MGSNGNNMPTLRETVMKNAMRYRKAEPGSCAQCAHRAWLDVHDPDGRPLGQAYRCDLLGAEHQIAADHVCDRFEAKEHAK
jgi:hypothetical protein